MSAEMEFVPYERWRKMGTEDILISIGTAESALRERNLDKKEIISLIHISSNTIEKMIEKIREL